MNHPTVVKFHPWLVSSGRMISTFCLILLVDIIFVASNSSQAVGEPKHLACNTDRSSGSRKIIKTPFELRDIYYQRFHHRGFNGTWISDSEIFYYSVQKRKFLVLDVETMEFRNSSIKIGSSDAVLNPIKISPHRCHVLISSRTIKQFRHSALGQYMLFHVKSSKFDQIAGGDDLTFIEWLPEGDDFVYVSKNNIYHAQINKTDVRVRKLTNDGNEGIVCNGIPDWIYEEEVLFSKSAIWISPNGNHLVFATFNDTRVKEAIYVHYGRPGSLQDQYATEVKIRWPKVGTRNPIVTLHVIDLSNPNSSLIALKAPIDIVGKDHILKTVSWLDNERIAVSWANRLQNRIQMVVYDTAGRENKVLYLSEEKAWVDAPLPIYQDGYMILLKQQESGTEAGRAKHVTRYVYKNDQLFQETDLTPGTIDVHTILGIGKLNSQIYFLANEFEAPSHTSLYSVSIHGNEKPSCISCNVITPEGNNCTHASVSFSREMSHYALLCNGPDPTVIGIYDRWNKELLTWDSHEDLRARLVGKMLPQIRDLTVLSHGFESKVRLLLPPDFDERKSYPMLVQVYAGPNTLMITDEAKFDFGSYMATNKNVIYAWIDGRGSSSRGSKLLHQIYRKLGVVEVEDQIAVTKYLQETYSWIDAKRTGIWGWSYGGYCTAMVLATDVEKVFKGGISVAPVSSWIYYDSIYTERYMGLPTEEDNLRGYNTSDVTRLVNGMRDKKFMLIHGTGDDNVHYQQSMALIKALQYADIEFEQITYPDEGHSLSRVRANLYHTMDRFWANCFGLSHKSPDSTIPRGDKKLAGNGGFMSELAHRFANLFRQL